jgi:hypothetical protein
MILRSLEFVGILLILELVFRTIVFVALTLCSKAGLSPSIRGSERAEFQTAEFVYGLALPLPAIALSYLGIKALTAFHYGNTAAIVLIVCFIVYAVLSRMNKVASLQEGIANVQPSLLGVVGEVVAYLPFLAMVQ